MQAEDVAIIERSFTEYLWEWLKGNAWGFDDERIYVDVHFDKDELAEVAHELVEMVTGS